MHFRLVYEGPLKANGSVRHKQEIRRYLHGQLSVLWRQPPLDGYHELLKETPAQGETSILQKLGAYAFAPLVCKKLRLIAELHIVFLRPEAPGSLITQGGDIDNRLKTLFDALRMPKVEVELPDDDLPRPGEAPFYCLLEDDNLITAVSVETDRLLRPPASDSHVQLMISVQTKPVVVTWDNVGM
jgi:hypothetical protein